MNRDRLNISSIETHLDEVIRKHVCKECYAGTLPSTLTEGVMKMVLIDCGVAINDLAAYGAGIVNIYLYAQPINGMKNVAAISELEKAFNKAMQENAFDFDGYHVPREVAYLKAGYDSTYNLHFALKAINITIT